MCSSHLWCAMGRVIAGFCRCSRCLAVLPAVRFPDSVLTPFERAVGLGLIVATSWLVILFAQIVSDLISARYRIDLADNLAARRIQTQIQVLYRIVVVIVVIVTISVMLMTFPAIRHIGVSLLASAGLAGLVVGMAMKTTLSSLIAGIQIAFTQPIRIKDVVVVEGEWGWIEEIGTTYVVVRIWDLCLSYRFLISLNTPFRIGRARAHICSAQSFSMSTMRSLSKRFDRSCAASRNPRIYGKARYASSKSPMPQNMGFSSARSWTLVIQAPLGTCAATYENNWFS